MQRLTQLSFFILAAMSFLTYIWFAIVSYRERERIAVRRSVLAAVLSANLFILFALLPAGFREIIFWVLIGSVVLITIGFFLPIGKIDAFPENPGTQFDERNIMFSRSHLKPDSPEFESYYQAHPENLENDNLFRKLPGIMSPKSAFANPILFASPEGSFAVTQALAKIVDGPVSDQKIELTADEITDYIKNLCQYYGALDVGITKLEPYHVYSHTGRDMSAYGQPIQLNHRYAIAFTVEMDFKMVGSNPKPPGLMESAKEYVEVARVAVQLAAAIRSLGYPALAHIDGKYQVIAPLVARDAGLGEIGRMGLLITPRKGPRVRLGIVTTDLPLLVDERKPDYTVIDFCNICKKCAVNCPTKSIPFDDRQMIDGALRWQINSDTCYQFWCKVGTDCGRCMTVCPYSHADHPLHNAVRWGISKSGMFRRYALLMDDLMYTKRPRSRKPPAWTQITKNYPDS
jgi:ferredoxin